MAPSSTKNSSLIFRYLFAIDAADLIVEGSSSSARDNMCEVGEYPTLARERSSRMGQQRCTSRESNPERHHDATPMTMVPHTVATQSSPVLRQAITTITKTNRAAERTHGQVEKRTYTLAAAQA